MKDELDPEVVADLRLREYTAKSRQGLSDAGFGQAIRDTATPKIVDRVPCRNRCGAVVGWTEEAEHTFDTFNRQLARKMEPQLDKTQIMFCPSCVAAGRELRAQGLRGLVDKIAVAIRELKDGCDDERQRELLKKLEKAGHPDVPGLEQWLREKAASKQGSRKFTRGSL